MTQSGPEFYAQTLAFTNTNVGVGQLPNFRYGVDPLPAAAAVRLRQLPAGSFGRINDPDVRTRTCTSSRSASRGR